MKTTALAIAAAALLGATGALDADKSGQITHAEYNASGWSMWSLHDRDRNGRVDADDAKVPVKDDFVQD